MKKTICVFDAYGTLFDIDSAARRVAEKSDNKKFLESWPKISQLWREKQLTYSWQLTLVEEFVDFWKITENSLDYALDFHGLLFNKSLRRELLGLYKESEVYKDVYEALISLKSKNVTNCILTNGTVSMLKSAICSANISKFIDSILSVDKIKLFKPKQEVYDMVLSKYNCDKDKIIFVSSNGWDIVGASKFGFVTVWLNRKRLPVERLPFTPTFEIYDLKAISEFVD